MSDQFDIFGGTQAPEPEPPRYLARDAGVPQGTQSRLFEPQMEGQLALDDEAGRILDVRRRVLESLPAVEMDPRNANGATKGADRGATTEGEGTTDE